jgi:2-polyprenyl-3-methyl-5-hydroxy-6-metoxy-1,4-benzoquinol methylase
LISSILPLGNSIRKGKVMMDPLSPPPVQEPATNLLERAWLDYRQGKTAAEFVITSSLGTIQTIPVEIFFREPSGFTPQEWVALELCRGRILDIGAGCGSHCLWLQDQGFEVWGLDASEVAIQIMRQRGVHHLYHGDLFSFSQPGFNTLLLLMNGIGIVQTLDQVQPFLNLARNWLAPGGQILFDSTDLNLEPSLDLSEDYPGNVILTIKYQGQISLPMRWLYLDSETLMHQADHAGWQCQILYQDREGEYLARLWC